ncbi:endolytic transglycosylase MltG [Irregularibacter muris]|uniref:Endolytic murein transglycosylase n=1 Tax=Irregularibacter muris TaxID=1796619 RepID=A0AAE3HF88_9FIRM|nr:endolytic transglycosylase MltG [Irregularibacter muris]MCR1897964.1 endolytic transglycosylase MltG [Irregularibacter muris]
MNQIYTKKKNKKTPIFGSWITLLILVVVIIGGAILYYHSLIGPVTTNGEEKIIEIPQGYSMEKIATLLEKEGIIKNKFAFQAAVFLENKRGKLQSGTYALNSSASTKEIIHRISNGEVISHSVKVTIPEGYELSMIAERLEEKGLTTKEKFLEAAQQIDQYNYSFLKEIPKDRKQPLEGYLFPDTYEFSKDISEEKIIETMLNRFNRAFKDEYYERAQELDMSTDDIIIMASLVEREARQEEERALIAGVYYNRLEINMLLQCDATVQYALEDRKSRLLYSDLKIDSPYNTYKYPGLPIGPISSVGEASLKAALYPENSPYLYYVAQSNGSHIFSKTLDEHNRAKQQVANSKKSNE